MPFGSHLLFLIFKVSNSVSPFLEADDWEVVSKSKIRTTFKFNFKNRKKGDDELAMFELLHALPSELTLEDIDIDWDRSDY